MTGQAREFAIDVALIAAILALGAIGTARASPTIVVAALSPGAVLGYRMATAPHFETRDLATDGGPDHE